MPTPWTAPKTWTSETLTSTDLNTYLRDNLLHLKENLPPGMAGSADIAGAGGAGTSEEWGTTTTGLSWSPSSPTTVDSHTTVLNSLYISNQADTTVRLGTKSWAPGSGAFDARMGHILMGGNSSAAAVSGGLGLHIGDSGNSNRLLVQMTYTFNTGELGFSAYTYAAASYTARGSTHVVDSPVPAYLRITRDGSNNVSFYYSLTGILWQFIATQAFTLTIANIGIYAAGNATAGFQAAIDWLRTSV